ncbi:glycine betaine ABC transporter substrate-binding protein [Bacillus carboniphilus]|uniref:Glycine betaine ABC transporter substrate-binding protein n=1 Tax=Bacillus carboniphilus TaxID=86663 RepID=A0ABY9JUZ6_9BACI|nr:glycine betaine ABC transporter substrate-binding protein [Bacillus carboniphilus]WLR42123.1 glycine betaine ABC transporter substrate-binding protein [Bacillus carboniphilus]
MKRFVMLSLLFVLSFNVILSGCSQGENEEGEKGNFVFGINNWAENIAVSNMWKIILENEGYSVELKELEKAAVWSGIAKKRFRYCP